MPTERSIFIVGLSTQTLPHLNLRRDLPDQIGSDPPAYSEHQTPAAVNELRFPRPATF